MSKRSNRSNRKRAVAWLLSVSMILGGNSFAVLADEAAPAQESEASVFTDEAAPVQEIEAPVLEEEAAPVQESEAVEPTEETQEPEEIIEMEAFEEETEGLDDSEPSMDDISVMGSISDAETQEVFETEDEVQGDAGDLSLFSDGIVLDGEDSALVDEESTATYETDVYVNGDIFYLNWDYPDGTDQLLRGETMTIGTEVYHEWFDNGEHRGETVTDYTLSIAEDSYDKDVVSVTVQENEVTIKAENLGGTNITVTAAGDGFEAYTDIWVNVEMGYCNLTPVRVDNVPVGENLDLSQVDWVLTEYYFGEDDKPASNVVDLDMADDIRLVAVEYDDNAWICQSEEDVDLPILTRKGNWDTSVVVAVMAKAYDDEGQVSVDDEGNEIWHEVGRRELWFNGCEYWIDLEYSYGDRDNSWVFTDEPLTISLVQAEDTPYELPEGYTLEWDIRQFQEDGPDEGEDPKWFTYEEQDGSVTLTVTELHEDVNWWIYVRAIISYEGEQLCDTDTSVGVREPWYDYHFPWYEPGEDQLLPDWNYQINNELDCYIENAEHPYGWNTTVKVTNVEILAQGWEWTEEGELIHDEEAEVLTCEENEYGWSLWALNGGSAKVAVTYESAGDGRELIEESYFHVSDQKFSLGTDYPEGTDTMLCNSEMTVATSLFHEYKDEDWNQRSEHIDDYELRVQTDEEGNLNYDTNLIDVEIVDNTFVKITSKGECGDTNIWLDTYLPGEEEPVTGNYIHVNVVDGYWNLTPLSVENVPLGEELDLSAVPWTVTVYYTDSEGENIAEEMDLDNDFIRLELTDYDDGAWNCQSEEDLPKLTRKGNWGTGVSVAVMVKEMDDDGEPILDEENNEIWNEYCRRELWFDGYDYWLDLAYSYGDWEHSFVFTDAPLTLSLVQAEDSPDELPEGYTVEWEVRQFTEDAEEGVEPEWMDYQVNEGGSLTLTADPEKLNEEINWWVNARAVVSYEDVQICDIETSVWAKAPYYEYYFPWYEPGEDQLLPDWNYHISNELDCYVETAEHPDGWNTTVKVTNVEILAQGWEWTDDGELIDDKEANVLTCEETEDGWLLWAQDGGSAKVAVTYESAEDGRELTEETYFHVSDHRYTLILEYPDGTDCMLPGGEMLISTSLYHEYVNEEGKHRSEYVDEYMLSVTDADGNPTYDTNLIDVEILENEDGMPALKITAKEECGDTNIWVDVYLPDDEENSVASNYFHVNVTDWYWNLTPSSVDNVAPGAELKLDEIPWVLTEYYIDSEGHAEKEIELTREDIRLVLTDYDSNAWECQSEEDLPAIKRIGNWGTNVSVAVMVNEPDEDGSENWIEYCRSNLWFDSFWCEADFTYSYGSRTDEVEDDTTVTSLALTDIPLVLTVDRKELEGIAGYEVYWEFWQDNEETGEAEDPTCVTYEIAEDGNSVSLLGQEGHEGEWVNVAATLLYEGEAVSGTWTHAMVETCEHQWEVLESTESGENTYQCSNCGVQKDAVDISRAVLTLSATSFYCTGSELEPSVTVKYGAKTLKEGVDYTLSYSNNINPGTGKVTVTGMGNYEGTLTAAFTIKLTTPKLGAATATGSNSIHVTWSAVPGAEKYILYYKTPSKSDWVRVVQDGMTATSYTHTITEVGSKHTYTVRAVYGSTLSSFDSAGVSATTALDTVKLGSAAANSQSKITVTWSSVPGAQGYRIYRKSGGSDWVGQANLSASTFSYADTGLAANTKYTYTVRAYVMVNGKQVLSPDYSRTGVSATTSTATVKLGSATANNAKQVTVTWSAAAGADGYRVYRKSGGSDWVGLKNVSAATRSYVDTTVLPGIKYTYTVRGYITENGTNILGGYSTAGVSVTTSVGKTTLGSATANSAKKVTVTWKTVPGADGYRVYRKSGGSDWVGQKNVSASTLSYADTNVTNGTKYTYTVRAYVTVNGTNVLGSYNTTGVSATPAVGKVTLGTATPNSAKQITLTWKAVPGADGYRVYRKSGGSDWVGQKNVSASTLSYVDTNVTRGVKYTYTVRAYETIKGSNVLGSYDTKGVSATPAVGTVKLGTIKANSTKKVTLTWNAVSGADGYRVYRKSGGSDWVGLKNVSASTLSYVDTTVKKGVKYTYTVRAYETIKGSNVLGNYNKTGLSVTP